MTFGAGGTGLVLSPVAPYAQTASPFLSMNIGRNLAWCLAVMSDHKNARLGVTMRLSKGSAPPHINRAGKSGTWVGIKWIQEQFPGECADAVLSGEPVEITQAKALQLAQEWRDKCKRT